MEKKENGIFSGWRGRKREKSRGKEDASGAFPKESFTPVLRCSICTGEQVAGFREKETGKFIDIMLIRNAGDLASFREQYGVEELVKEY